MDGQLLVTPEELRRTANELKGTRDQVTSITQQMLDESRNLTSVWEGEAANAYVNKFNTLEDDIDRMRRMLYEHVADLLDMAGIYEGTERRNEEAAQSLPRM